MIVACHHPLETCRSYFKTSGYKSWLDTKNKTNHPISSNSHPSATLNKTIHSLKIRGVQNQREHHIILTEYEAVHSTAVTENSSSSGMLIINNITVFPHVQRMISNKFENTSIIYVSIDRSKCINVRVHVSKCIIIYSFMH